MKIKPNDVELKCRNVIIKIKGFKMTNMRYEIPDGFDGKMKEMEYEEMFQMTKGASTEEKLKEIQDKETEIVQKIVENNPLAKIKFISSETISHRRYKRRKAKLLKKLAKQEGVI